MSVWRSVDLTGMLAGQDVSPLGDGSPPLWDPPGELIAALRGVPPGSVSGLPPGRRGWARTRVLQRCGSMVLWREGARGGKPFLQEDTGGQSFSVAFPNHFKKPARLSPGFTHLAIASAQSLFELAVMEQPAGSYQPVAFCRLQYPTLNNFTFPAETEPTIQA